MPAFSFASPGVQRAAACVGLLVPLAFGAIGTGDVTAAAPAAVPYLVILDAEPLAAYAGGVAGIRPATRDAGGRLDAQAPSARAYVTWLAQRQQDIVQDLSQALGRDAVPLATLQHALDGVVLELDAGEASLVAAQPGVLRVEAARTLRLLTDRAPSFVGAPSIWDGSATGGLPTEGEGVVIGVLDSGINWQSPSFAAVGPFDNYVHTNPNGAGNYLGLCGPTPPNGDLGHCNDKLIGMYDFTSLQPTRSGNDLLGHGSHTAGTAAGNHWQAPFGGGTFLLSGVAPHANLIAYKVCTTSCDSLVVVQGIDQAVADGVDVIDYPIAGGGDPWVDATSIALRNAVGAGIFVAAAAGSNGPIPASVEHDEPWVQTVAATTKDNVVAFTFDLTGPGSPPPATQGLPLRPAAPPFPTADFTAVPIVRSPDFLLADGNDGCTPYPPDTFTVPSVPAADTVFADGFDGGTPGRRGAIAVIRYDGTADTCDSIARQQAAIDAGAIGVVFVGIGFLDLDASGAAWSMLLANWNAAWAVIQSDPAGATATLRLPATSFPQRGDVLAKFSGRGPGSAGGQVLVKPDVAAPGINILAAWTAQVGGSSALAMNTGTSMASAVVAGAGALLRALHPDWSPTELRAAMSLTGVTEGVITANGEVATTWDIGSGRIDLARAARSGVVLDETLANYVAADPGAGGDVSSLNLPQMASACAASCTFTRTLRSTSLLAQDYTLAIAGLPAGAASVLPTAFTLAPGGTQVIEVTVDGSLLPAGSSFGQLDLVPGDVLAPTLHLPLVVQP